MEASSLEYWRQMLRLAILILRRHCVDRACECAGASEEETL
jgi:hypothetical protein